MIGLNTLLLSDGELRVLLALISAIGIIVMLPAPRDPGRDRLGLRIAFIAALAIAGLAGFAEWSTLVRDGRMGGLVADAGEVLATHR